MTLQWNEISNGVGNAPAWTLASRTDEVVASRAEGIAAIVQAASQAANSMSVTYAIDRAKPRVEQQLQSRFAGHENGGILVVAGVIPQHGGYMFSYLNPVFGIYAQPHHAYSVWDGIQRMEDPSTEHRFFWVTRATA